MFFLHSIRRCCLCSSSYLLYSYCVQSMVFAQMKHLLQMKTHSMNIGHEAHNTRLRCCMKLRWYHCNALLKCSGTYTSIFVASLPFLCPLLAELDRNSLLLYIAVQKLNNSISERKSLQFLYNKCLIFSTAL